MGDPVYITLGGVAQPMGDEAIPLPARRLTLATCLGVDGTLGPTLRLQRQKPSAPNPG